MPRFWIAERYAEYCGYIRKRFERLPAREGRTSTLFNNSKNWASSAQEFRPNTPGHTKRLESEMRREPLNTSIPVPRLQCGSGLIKHTGGTYSHGGMIGAFFFLLSLLPVTFILNFVLSSLLTVFHPAHPSPPFFL